MEANPEHRSSLDTLNELSSSHLFLYLDRPRADTMGRLPLGKIGLKVSRYVAKRFGAEREEGVRVCSREARELLGLRSLAGFSAGERLAWERWSPLALILPGVRRWKPGERRALAAIMRAKGGRHESDYLTLFNRHDRLRRALVEMARGK
jgi:hypothetical protein